MKNPANVEFFVQTSFSRKKGQNENCFHQSLLSRGTSNIGKKWKKLFWDKKLHKSITVVIFNETKNFFDQNFSFYNWSKHKNFNVTYHWWEGLFFVLFYCHVRRCPKTGFPALQKKNSCVSYCLSPPKFASLPERGHPRSRNSWHWALPSHFEL